MNHPETANPLEEEIAAEQRFIANYVELTGAPEPQARDVYLYFDIIRERNLATAEVG